MQQLVQRHGVYPVDRSRFVDQAFCNHIYCHFQRGLGGTLAGTRLKHPQFAALDGKLDVLHVLVMPFQQVKHLCQLAISFGHRLFHRRKFGTGSLSR